MVEKYGDGFISILWIVGKIQWTIKLFYRILILLHCQLTLSIQDGGNVGLMIFERIIEQKEVLGKPIGQMELHFDANPFPHSKKICFK